MRLLEIFRQQHEAEEAVIADRLHDAMVEEVRPEPDLLDHNIENTSRVIGKLKAQEQMLEALIADRTERLRQTKVSIAAFEAAADIMSGGRR